MNSERITQLLADIKGGDRLASSELLPLVYDELRGLARSLMHRGAGAAAHTLQPTALVNEACMKIMGQTNLSLQSRAHLFAVAAMAMRQVLSNHARAKRADKRGGAGLGGADGASEAAVGRRQRVTLSGISGGDREVDLLELDDVLTKLERLDPRQAHLVSLRFLGGMTMEAAAGILGISLSSCEREWRAARAFLLSELGADAGGVDRPEGTSGGGR
jgi:RNA polymerase sigma-70 factor, ECF subfamily